MTLKYPGIPSPTLAPESLRESVVAVKTGFETLVSSKGDLAKNAASIATNAANTATNTANIATNAANIATNTADIATINSTLTAVQAAWTSYTPTITAMAGAFTSVSATGRYKLVGKTLYIQVMVTVTTVGTASGGIIVTLPAGLVPAGNQILNASNWTTGALILGYTQPTTNNSLNVYISTIANQQYIVGGVIEVA